MFCRQPPIRQLLAQRVKLDSLLHWVFTMAAPVPPPGGGAGGARGGGGPPLTLPPPPVPGLAGPPGPPGPPGPLPAGDALLAQLVAAIQAVAAGAPAPGPGGLVPPLPRVKLPLRFSRVFQEKDQRLIY